MLIGISGKKGSGKDTVAEMLMEHLEGFEVKRFAGKLKQIVSLLTGMPAHALEHEEVKRTRLPSEWQNDLPGLFTYRKALQLVGTELFRDRFHKNTWVNALFADFHTGWENEDDRPGDAKDWIIPDVRFPNEYDRIKLYDGIMIRVERPGLPEDDHPSETALDNHKFDIVVDNNSDLEVLRFMVLYSVLPKIKHKMS